MSKSSSKKKQASRQQTPSKNADTQHGGPAASTPKTPADGPAALFRTPQAKTSLVAKQLASSIIHEGPGKACLLLRPARPIAWMLTLFLLSLLALHSLGVR